jgi:hypothetical protein
MEKLLPCPACGSEAEHSIIMEYANCSNKRCRLIGPDPDPDGSRWNALPRSPTAKAPEPAPVKPEPKQYQPPERWERHSCTFEFTRKGRMTVCGISVNGNPLSIGYTLRNPYDEPDQCYADRLAVKRALANYPPKFMNDEEKRTLYDAFRYWQFNQPNAASRRLRMEAARLAAIKPLPMSA